ncbi:UbiX family flavin prenyltransferase [Candidatus Micrarchaeota archaeon]|nr:UbiX family flavin prenyltransferase [Candidatus Micrarchaeota archaeon]
MKACVAITGASGTAYGVELVKALAKAGVETHAVASEGAKEVAKHEGVKITFAKNIRIYNEKELATAPASGSALFDAVIVCPCSMKTLAAIAHGFSDNLVTRAADVMLKEKRMLVLVVRETPLSQIHLENMLKLSRMGTVILPASPAFYHKPKKIEEMVAFVVGKILDVLRVENKQFKRWKGK